jgi:hypothetical protein
LASAAASFCRDVSKCRKVVAFAGETGEHVLPFLGLSSAPGGSGTPGYDVEEIVGGVLGPKLASSFLDAQTTVTQIQRMAEEAED